MRSELEPDATGAPAVLLLDVGQGDASLIVLPGTPRRAIVVDCNDFHVVDRHLRDFGVERLSAVVFTHLDLDHLRGGQALVKGWHDRIDVVLVARDGRSITAGSAAAELFGSLIELAKPATQSGPDIEFPERRREPLARGDGWRVRVVAPFAAERLAQDLGGAAREPNEHSAVVRVERDLPGGGVLAVLIGGDAPLRVLSDLPRPDLAASVFRV